MKELQLLLKEKTFHILERAGYTSVESIQNAGAKAIMQIKGIGEKRFHEIRNLMLTKGEPAEKWEWDETTPKPKGEMQGMGKKQKQTQVMCVYRIVDTQTLEIVAIGCTQDLTKATKTLKLESLRKEGIELNHHYVLDYIQINDKKKLMFEREKYFRGYPVLYGEQNHTKKEVPELKESDRKWKPFFSEHFDGILTMGEIILALEKAGRTEKLKKLMPWEQLKSIFVPPKEITVKEFDELGLNLEMEKLITKYFKSVMDIKEIRQEFIELVEEKAMGVQAMPIAGLNYTETEAVEEKEEEEQPPKKKPMKAKTLQTVLSVLTTPQKMPTEIEEKDSEEEDEEFFEKVGEYMDAEDFDEEEKTEEKEDKETENIPKKISRFANPLSQQANHMIFERPSEADKTFAQSCLTSNQKNKNIMMAEWELFFHFAKEEHRKPEFWIPSFDKIAPDFYKKGCFVLDASDNMKIRSLLFFTESEEQEAVESLSDFGIQPVFLSAMKLNENDCLSVNLFDGDDYRTYHMYLSKDRRLYLCPERSSLENYAILGAKDIGEIQGYTKMLVNFIRSGASLF